ncbi:thiolase family protein [Colwellia psychrerythraea]|uniref:Acetyl-CoA acetyltransferase n=1 Tax=Colwellia psychrerythraea TaxID=28229 RepID=A0A099KRG8_COLPS|nr:acetyl-CoA C-acyltransferase [Colwellia psychrerythraea]KGJ93354.1 acetyl-CoA acetyltransferase [Colwellia psychrerythraea]
MLADDPIVIVSAQRTAMGSFQGCFKDVVATDLAATAIKAALEKSLLTPEDIDEVIMGCVLPAGLGQAPARQATLKAGLSQNTSATTINKVCGSGIKAMMFAHDLIKSGSMNIVIAGGMENMTNAPYMLANARAGFRMGHGSINDHMMTDGLEDAYENKAMGCFAQTTADENHLTREDMDTFAINSLAKATQAISAGAFDNEIAPFTVKNRRGDTIIDTDEAPALMNIKKIPNLRAAFAKDGTITAANASSISDGAAALILMKASTAKQKGLTPLARIIAHASYAQAPKDFTLAPIGAIKNLLTKSQWQQAQVDLWEINEAFAMVTMLAINELDIDPAKVNVNGGACALGHPLGASGARIVTTLLHALLNRNLKKGVASLCIGGGEAVAIAIEVI